MIEKDNGVSCFFNFVQMCEAIRVTSIKNKKVDLISHYIS